MSLLEQIVLSAAVDLRRRRMLPANDEAAVRAVLRHADAFRRGQVRFPILLPARAEAELDDDGDGTMQGLFSKLKKKLKKLVKDRLTLNPLKVIKEDIDYTKQYGPGAAQGCASGASAGGWWGCIAGAAVATGTQMVSEADAEAYNEAAAKALAPPPPGSIPTEPEILGIPSSYLPWIVAGGALAYMLLRR